MSEFLEVFEVFFRGEIAKTKTDLGGSDGIFNLVTFDTKWSGKVKIALWWRKKESYKTKVFVAVTK